MEAGWLASVSELTGNSMTKANASESWWEFGSVAVRKYCFW